MLMQLALPPEIEAFVQQQLSTGKYRSSADLILAAIELLRQQEDIYQGRLFELQQDALVGLEDLQQGRVADGATAIAQIRSNLRDRHHNSNI
jgi:antitoxin ParD1/3/4